MSAISRCETLAMLPRMAKLLLLSCVVALLAGTASAFFLHSLVWATAMRDSHRYLLCLLPLAGFVVGWVYLRYGSRVEAGNNLLIDEIHDPTRIVPLRMVPLVLWGTVMSHLFGASVGREGTAVQMGGALADQITHVLRLGNADRRILLMCGIAAGFASVFGTPLAGAVFALEVLAIGRMRYDALFPCLLAAIVADQVGLAWGVQHTHYAIQFIPAISGWTLLATLAAGALFGLVGKLFADSTHALAAVIKQLLKYPPLRPLLGGVLLLAIVWPTGADRFVGLGIPVIVEAFQQPLPPYDFAAKLGLTVLSLASGFKGGEVTPLFFIGATLGNALSPLLQLPFSLLAGLGFVAVFAGAANTPLASTFMAMELFGSEVGIYAALACVASYYFSGHSGIYRSQRIAHGKHRPFPRGLKLSELAAWRQRDQ
ncbi:voltage-gated chloride channel family protein [Aquitalea magnusonii]|uniref:H+/Cl-antiporter ClcA n=1 Tax=Aquitalea magnusonii TaxID=332411 RepID=A0A318JIJ8_9NEIS|nr:voltage-gated chloride channel family protein [Aquitalea magnusonii]PXX50634.1 H+/Cl- antiporter ClcA [Aquitalea magnusonii]